MARMGKWGARKDGMDQGMVTADLFWVVMLGYGAL